jgi:hypothetical protein
MRATGAKTVPVEVLRDSDTAEPRTGTYGSASVGRRPAPIESDKDEAPGERRVAGWQASGAPIGQGGLDDVEYRPVPETPAMKGPSKEAIAALGIQRPPVPVIVASALLGLATAGFVVLAMFMATLGPAIVLAPLCGATLTGFLAVGLWRGARGANLVTLLLAAVCVYTGISNLITGSGGGALTALPRILLGGALLGLLLGHPTTRRHFWS